MANFQTSKVSEDSNDQVVAKRCFRLSIFHHEAANTLSGPKNQLVPLSRVPPIVVLRSFSIELIIKAGTIVRSGLTKKKRRKIHELDKLFERLDSVAKKKSIEEFSRRTNSDLKVVLRKERNSFVDWRYIHEHEPSNDNVETGLGTLRDAFEALYLGIVSENPVLVGGTLNLVGETHKDNFAL